MTTLATDIINAMSPNLSTGSLDLLKLSAKPIAQADVLVLMGGEEKSELRADHDATANGNGYENGDGKAKPNLSGYTSTKAL